MHNNVDTLFQHLWDNYLEVTPSAVKVHELLGSTQKDDIINDHIALRTFNIEKVGLEKLAAHFKAVGYKECGEYHFEAKKLYAKHFEHQDPTKPKVFISELLVDQFSKNCKPLSKTGWITSTSPPSLPNTSCRQVLPGKCLMRPITHCWLQVSMQLGCRRGVTVLTTSQ